MADVAFPMHPRCGFSQIPQPADVSTQQLAPGQHRAAVRSVSAAKAADSICCGRPWTTVPPTNGKFLFCYSFRTE